MYTITFHDFQVQCQSADEVRELCNSENGSGPYIPDLCERMAAVAATIKPARRKYRTKSTDQRGSKMAERWAKARRYAKRHDVTVAEAFKLVSR
jgi:hypothetical protein